MIPYFPFVLFSNHISIEALNAERPCACLAALAAASHADVMAQKELGTLFKQVVAHMHLVTSIISDLRLDKPRKLKLWSVEGGKDKNKPDWGSGEMRALAGAYYLSSSSSIILQKTRQSFHTPYVLACCQHLASLNEYPTDKYLPYMVSVQILIEEIEDLVCKSTAPDGLQFSTESQEISRKCADVKSTLPFPLSESPPLLLQIHILELLLSQSSPRGTAFGLDKFQNQFQDETSLMDWLSASMSAARSLISIISVMPQGEEMAMSNMGWIMMNCALNLAVRLDLIAAKGSISGFTQHLRRFLDMRYTLRQLVLRFEAIPGLNAPLDHPFHSLAKRLRRLEDWYLSQIEHQVAESCESISPQVSDQAMINISPGSTAMPMNVSMPYQNAATWPVELDWCPGPELDISTFLFADPIEFPMNFAYGS
ncbi:cercosporin resistance protein [Fusarium heterosporum]|uniref:Cercosporin resistance protein n=1 Tax=Fusarium heterosporum TaxID=42747 RepID=A0A8H5TID8_FUSHE|nr:cercosporin resistance protein [Fusarium heterosporum]